ncbi:MAG: hypothetical protein ACI9Y7_002424 [Dokdonia sp.]|jgi:hypothetical protein
MKLFKNIPLLVLAIFFLFSACRTEDEEIINPPEQQTLDANAADLIIRTTTNDGSDDNILDNANCLSIQLPVTIIIDGLEIIIDSEDDLDTIEAIFDEFDDDIDELDFIFPITIILSDFTEIIITNIEELESFIDECSGENESDDDIECIDFQYPITYAIFDQNNELIETVTINNDQEHYEFIENLDDTDIVTINFPLTLILSNGDTVTVSNIIELENAIEDAIDDCDEDDDNDYDDDDCEDCTTDDLTSILTDCAEWEIDKLERDDNDLEDNYNDVLFSFDADGTITIDDSGVITNGTWDAVVNNTTDVIEVTIAISGDENVSDTWRLHEIEEETGEVKVDLRIGDDRLRFESTCDNEEEDFDCPNLEANIGDACENPNGNNGTINENCECVVEEEEFDCPDLEANIGDTCENQNGNNGTINENCECEVEEEEFDCPNLEANIGDACENPNGNNGTINENCECEVEEEEFDCPNLEANIGDACENPNGNNGTISENCECVEEEEDGLETILLSGDWVGTADSSNGNLDVILEGFVFDFNEDNIVIASNGDDDVDGFWEVSDNDTVFELEFPNDPSGLFLLNNTYTVISIEDDRIELAINNDPEELLIFERL